MKSLIRRAKEFLVKVILVAIETLTNSVAYVATRWVSAHATTSSLPQWVYEVVTSLPSMMPTYNVLHYGEPPK